MISKKVLVGWMVRSQREVFRKPPYGLMCAPNDHGQAGFRLGIEWVRHDVDCKASVGAQNPYYVH